MTSIDGATAGPTEREARLDLAAVCTLSDGGAAERLAWVRSEILPHAVASAPSEDGIAWELVDAPGLAHKLDELIRLERECCSGIEFEHRPSPTAGRRRFSVRGVDPGAAVFASLHVPARRPRRFGARLAKAATLGTGLSLFVCCVLPLVLAALVGAAAAAPFASLDDPWIIAGAAVVSGGAAFAWQGRRRASAPPKTADAPNW